MPASKKRDDEEAVRDERADPRSAAPDAEARLRYLLRAITVGVVLALLVFRVLALPLIQFLSGTEIRDDGYVLGALIGALLLLLGIEAPTFLSGLGGKK